jgi:SAM-dependent methyltransferase
MTTGSADGPSGGGRVRRLLTEPLRRRVRRLVVDEPSLTGHLRPLRPEAQTFVTHPPRSPSPDPPLPDPDRWELSEPTDAAGYLRSGSADADAIRAAVARHGGRVVPGTSVLDLGCGFGRVLRWFHDLAPHGEVWGVDIDAERIDWCRQHLDPQLCFACCSTSPHLPFEDGSFDLVFACSVLPHIADLGDAWMLEIRRVLVAGGFAYVTIYDEHTVAAVLDRGESAPLAPVLRRLDAAHGLVGGDFERAVLSRRPGSSQVVYSRAYIERVWGAWFEVCEAVPEAFHVQTALVLRKRRTRRAGSTGG